MIHWSAEAHRRRLQNIGLAERSVRRALRRHLIRDYLPGQVTYNLGEYPCARPYEPSEADERLLDEYRDAFRAVFFDIYCGDFMVFAGGGDFNFDDFVFRREFFIFADVFRLIFNGFISRNEVCHSVENRRTDENRESDGGYNGKYQDDNYDNRDDFQGFFHEISYLLYMGGFVDKRDF